MREYSNVSVFIQKNFIFRQKTKKGLHNHAKCKRFKWKKHVPNYLRDMPWKTESTAVSVSLISCSVCRMVTNQASYLEGARLTPC